MLISLQNYSLWLKFSILIPKVNVFMQKARAETIHAFSSHAKAGKIYLFYSKSRQFVCLSSAPPPAPQSLTHSNMSIIPLTAEL